MRNARTSSVPMSRRRRNAKRSSMLLLSPPGVVGHPFLPKHDATWRSPVHPKKRYSLKLVEVRGFSEVKVAKRIRREVPEICRFPVRVQLSSPERSMIHTYLSG